MKCDIKDFRLWPQENVQIAVTTALMAYLKTRCSLSSQDPADAWASSQEKTANLSGCGSPWLCNPNEAMQTPGSTSLTSPALAASLQKPEPFIDKDAGIHCCLHSMSFSTVCPSYLCSSLLHSHCLKSSSHSNHREIYSNVFIKQKQSSEATSIVAV